jgi:vacuolar-type H+-ATPase subunit H
MLVLTTKKYEIEETVQAKDENDVILYEFTMQITSKELGEINNIIFNKESIELAQKLSKLENRIKNEYSEELEKAKEKIEARIEELVNENQKNFEDICFKEHKEPFKLATGEYKYIEMVQMIFDFFWNALISKKSTQINTMSSDLRKIGAK